MLLQKKRKLSQLSKPDEWEDIEPQTDAPATEKATKTVTKRPVTLTQKSEFTVSVDGATKPPSGRRGEQT
uniref:EIF4E n=1 Tax=Bursaphelenchus xylophilus TaxID=6326 RepID=A0A1I7SPF3_BURXY